MCLRQAIKWDGWINMPSLVIIMALKWGLICVEYLSL